MDAEIANPSTWRDTEFLCWSDFWKAVRYQDLDLLVKSIDKGLNLNIQWSAFVEKRVLTVAGRETWLTISSGRCGSPLHEAARINNEAFVQLLLSRGATPKIRSIDGSSPLHESVLMSNNKVSILLLKHGANVNRKIVAEFPHGDDVTSLHIACRRSDIESTKLLLSAGAQPDAQAIDNALFNSDYRILQLLLSYGGSLNSSSPGFHHAHGEAVWRGQKLFQTLLTGHYSIERFAGLSESQLDNAINEHAGPFEQIVKALRKSIQEWLYHPSLFKSTSREKLCTYCEDLIHSSREIPTSTQVQEIRSQTCAVCRIITDERLWSRGLFDGRHSRQKVKVKFSDGRDKVEGWRLERYLSIGYPQGQLAQLLSRLQACHDDGTESEGTMALARAWLLQCLTDHKTCTASTETLPNMPTRVIDVGNGLEEPRLYVTCAKPGIYCALSYCWGRQLFLRTTKASLSHHQKSIPLKDLPKTLKDAVLICRQLSIQYLWIDALCIVQDDPGDWAKESEKMASIYRNATVTIVASAAEDTSKGCFQPRARNRVWPVKIPDRFSAEDRRVSAASEHHQWNHSGDLSERHASTDPGIPKDDFYVFPDFVTRPKGPIDQRAWCTQEYFMSSRILYWSQELYWECRCSIASEARPGGNRDQNFLTRRTVREASLSTECVVADHAHMDAILYDWELVVEDYAQRQITMQSDRLIALAGMASTVERVINCEYIAGLWGGEQLCRSLLWEVRDLDPADVDVSSGKTESNAHTLKAAASETTGGQSMRRMFPSWCWASCLSGPRKVSYNRWDEPMRAERKTSRSPIETVEVISTRTDDIFTKKAITGEIVLKGRLREMKIHNGSDHNSSYDLARNIVQIIPVEELIAAENSFGQKTTDFDDYQLSESPPIEAKLNHPIVDDSAPKEWLDFLKESLEDKRKYRHISSKSLGIFPHEAPTNTVSDDLMARLQRLESLETQQRIGALDPVPIASRRHYWIKDDLSFHNKEVYCLPIAFWEDLMVGLCLEAVAAEESRFRRVGLCAVERSGNNNWEEDVVFENWKEIPKVEVTLL